MTIDVIGKTIDEAKQILAKFNYDIQIKENLSDKQKLWDNKIVVRQKKSDNIIELTISKFKMEI